ncbi:MAG TPA: hypothetical protein VJ836_03900 [Candidatus Saccharimonadales bacterium]|nr:hypothetical protein [Candidatus Saccharimonadales bacterium]
MHRIELSLQRRSHPGIWRPLGLAGTRAAIIKWALNRLADQSGVALTMGEISDKLAELLSDYRAGSAVPRAVRKWWREQFRIGDKPLIQEKGRRSNFGFLA